MPLGSLFVGSSDLRWTRSDGGNVYRSPRHTSSRDSSISYSASTDGEDVRTYMKRVGLDAWYDYFDKHLPANVKSIALLRATTATDLRRMATKANMRLDAKTTQQVLDALKKQP